MNTSRVSIDLGTVQVAEAVHGALLPEMNDGPEGSTTIISLDGSLIVADIEAHDLSTLRAALNGFVRLADAAHQTAR